MKLYEDNIKVKNFFPYYYKRNLYDNYIYIIINSIIQALK